jgi:ribosome-associated translation inhibitor RaiA
MLYSRRVRVAAVSSVEPPPRTEGRNSRVNETKSWTVICPCCEATIVVDAQTGVVISHEEKPKPLASFEEMAKEMERQKKLREQVFAQELGSQKDRERLLEEKFREALKKADKSGDKPYRNPLDLD